MKLRRLTALLLCAFFFLSILAGCGNTEDDAVDNGGTNGTISEPTPPDVTGSDPPEPGSIDFDAALATFAPDTKMVTAGDLYITWADLYIFLFRIANDLMHFSEDGIKWDEQVEENATLAESVLEYATEEAISFIIFEYGLKELNVTLSAADLEELEGDLQNLIDMYGGKDALEELLRENSGFYSFEVFERLIRIEFSVERIMSNLYGDDAALFPDERVEEYAQRNGFMFAQHILISSTEDPDEALTKAEDILSELNARINDDDFLEFFDSMMHEHSEDPGSLSSFPEGYLFQFEDMVEPFSEASAELKPGEMSGLVETQFGYHIILRLPMNYDVSPISEANHGSNNTLRQIAVLEDFDALLREWRDSLNIVFTPEYNSIDLETIFKQH